MKKLIVALALVALTGCAATPPQHITDYEQKMAAWEIRHAAWEATDWEPTQAWLVEYQRKGGVGIQPFSLSYAERAARCRDWVYVNPNGAPGKGDLKAQVMVANGEWCMIAFETSRVWEKAIERGPRKPTPPGGHPTPTLNINVLHY